ncbi:MAG: radical SAM protein, partial [Candidatus Odinarchaeota archaeon]
MSFEKEAQRIFNSSPRDYGEYLERGWRLTRECHEEVINFYAPSILKYDTEGFEKNGEGVFQSVSVTGRRCLLMCEHCKGRLLESMHSATTPEELLKLGKNLFKKGARGLLISGGSDMNGAVPLTPFINAIGELHRHLGMKIAVHTGLIDYSTAKALKEAGVESAMIDIIGDTETIREIYHLDKKPGDFEKALKALTKAGLDVSPHIVVGLNKGRIVGELKALEIITRSKAENIVIVALKPLDVKELTGQIPKPVDIGRIIT